jgi:drug/metabolite transporter (DMT)-like permease
MSTKKSIIIGTVAVSFSAILWGLDGTVLTPRLYNLNVGLVVFVLHLIPFVVMNFFLYKQYKYIKKFSKTDVLIFLAIALFGGALGTLSIVKALFLVNFQKLSVVVLLQKLQPVFAIGLAAVLLKEKLGKNYLLWASLAIVAGYFLSFGFALPNVDSQSNNFLASMFALLAAFSFGSSTVFSKMILSRYHFFTATFYRYGFTSLLMLLYVLFTKEIFDFSQLTNNNWLIILIISFTTGSGAIFLYYYGLRKIKAIIATISELFFPISVIVFDYIFNGETLTLIQWVSVLVMIFAILKLNQTNTKKNKK